MWGQNEQESFSRRTSYGSFSLRPPKFPKTPFSGCSPHSIPTSFDGVHPNEKGYAIVGPLAQAVIDKTLWK